MSIEAMKQALEALERHYEHELSLRGIARHEPAITALRTAIEAAEKQEPVAWRSQNATPPGGFVIFQQYPQALADLGRKIEPLYTTPPAALGYIKGDTRSGLVDNDFGENT